MFHTCMPGNMNIPSFFGGAGPSSRPERPLSATRKNECEKDPDVSVSAVVKAMQIENEALQRDLQRQTVSTSPQKVWQHTEKGCLSSKPPMACYLLYIEIVYEWMVMPLKCN